MPQSRSKMPPITAVSRCAAWPSLGSMPGAQERLQRRTTVVWHNASIVHGISWYLYLWLSVLRTAYAACPLACGRIVVASGLGADPVQEQEPRLWRLEGHTGRRLGERLPRRGLELPAATRAWGFRAKSLGSKRGARARTGFGWFGRSM